MGLPNFHCAFDGLLPLLLMNTLLLLLLLKNRVSSLLCWKLSSPNSEEVQEEEEDEEEDEEEEEEAEEEEACPYNGRDGRVLITSYKPCSKRNSECCVCLCGFEAEEEGSVLGCQHFFHEACLAKWFHTRRSTCPLCRSLA